MTWSVPPRCLQHGDQAGDVAVGPLGGVNGKASGGFDLAMLLGREPGRIEAIHGLSFVYFQVGRNGIIIKRHDLEVLDIARLVGIQDGLAISQHPLGPPVVVFGVRIKNLLPSQGVHDILAFDVPTPPSLSCVSVA